MGTEMPDCSQMRRRRPAGRGPVLDVTNGRLDALLRALSPVPERLVSRVLELPRLESALAQLTRGDPRSLHAALAAVGLEPDAKRVRMLRLLRGLRQVREGGSEISSSRARDMR
jgi:hypothetical protein